MKCLSLTIVWRHTASSKYSTLLSAAVCTGEAFSSIMAVTASKAEENDGWLVTANAKYSIQLTVNTSPLVVTL
jgi:hypothetical protein